MLVIDANKVSGHYRREDLAAHVAAALAEAGFVGGSIKLEDLASFDQFHSRGLAATVDLAAAVAPRAAELVLDVGSGLGGPSRYLAETYGCHVEGVDLSPSFVEVATALAERTGLADKVGYQVANALTLPFESGHFDVAWTQHVAMNISDRAGLYGEIARVLRPGGRFGLYDVTQGVGGPIHFPVPWSKGPETSFLLTPGTLRDHLERQGFRVTSWVDRTQGSIAWFSAMKVNASSAKMRPPIGLGLAMGPDFPVMSANLDRNLREGRAVLIEAVLELR